MLELDGRCITTWVGAGVPEISGTDLYIFYNRDTIKSHSIVSIFLAYKHHYIQRHVADGHASNAIQEREKRLQYTDVPTKYLYHRTRILPRYFCCLYQGSFIPLQKFFSPSVYQTLIRIINFQTSVDIESFAVMNLLPFNVINFSAMKLSAPAIEYCVIGPSLQVPSYLQLRLTARPRSSRVDLRSLSNL